MTNISRKKSENINYFLDFYLHRIYNSRGWSDFMKWAIPQLRKLAKPFTFEYDYDLLNELVVKDDIKDVKKCHVSGVCYEVSYDEYLFDLNIDLELVMVCSVSLLDVFVPLTFDTKVRYSYSIDDSSDDYLITKDTINLDEAVLSEIVLNIPLKVVKEGYENEFMEEEETLEEEINPSFKALKDLYGGEAK
jgi:uncharacterized metal-binding protein YceD (DUF177 family)